MFTPLEMQFFEQARAFQKLRDRVEVHYVWGGPPFEFEEFAEDLPSFDPVDVLTDAVDVEEFFQFVVKATIVAGMVANGSFRIVPPETDGRFALLAENVTRCEIPFLTPPEPSDDLPESSSPPRF